MSGDDERIVIVHRKSRVFDKYFKIDEVEVTHSRLSEPGFIRNVQRLIFERGDSASALIHETDTDMIVLTEQFRPPTYDKGPGWLVETIAGAIERDETPEQCIRREMLEELGYRAGELQVICAFYASPGGSSERIFMFYAPLLAKDLVRPEASGLQDQQEDIARVRIPRKDFIEKCMNGEYVDAKLLAAGFWLAAGGAAK